MGYLSIDNLYKNQDILLFKECYALEKCHGTSASLTWKLEASEAEQLRFFSGGATHANFVAIFDHEALRAKFKAHGLAEVIIYGEAYGGKEQGMSEIYGKSLKFVVFDVQIDGNWISVPQMDDFAKGMGLEVVPWVKVPTTLAALDAERDRPSIIAERNGCGTDKQREGVVLRPLIEVRKNNDERVICKHKGEKFSERATPQAVVDPERLKVLDEAGKIAEEWVTVNRLTNILSHWVPEDVDIKNTPKLIAAMTEDVLREAAGEIVDSKEARKAIGKLTAQMFKAYFQERLRNSEAKANE